MTSPFDLKFELRVYSNWLSVVSINDPKNKSKKIKELTSGVNSGEINNIEIESLPISSQWKDYLTKNGSDFRSGISKTGSDFESGMSRRDLENFLKADPSLHDKVHFFTEHEERYWIVYFSNHFYDWEHVDIPKSVPVPKSKSCTVMFKSRKLKSKSSKSKRRSKKSKKTQKSK